MTYKRFTVQVGERGRFVVPASVRRRLHLKPGDVVVIEEEHDRFVVRKAADVARGLEGYLSHVQPRRDLASELLAERREARREAEGT